MRTFTFKSRNGRKKIKGKRSFYARQGYDKAKLKSQGLWDESNNRSTLVVTRVEKDQSQLETRKEKTS